MTAEEKRAKHAAYMRGWKKRNPEKVNAINRRVKAKNPDLYKQINEESRKRMREAHPETFRAMQRRYRDVHGEEMNARSREWFKQHPDYSRKWQAEDNRRYPAKPMVDGARARAKRLGLPFDLDWRQIEIPKVCPVLGIEIIQGQKGFCDHSPSLDRLIPSLGYVASNVRVISYRANAIKRDATVDELRALVAYLERELG